MCHAVQQLVQQPGTNGRRRRVRDLHPVFVVEKFEMASELIENRHFWDELEPRTHHRGRPIAGVTRSDGIDSYFRYRRPLIFRKGGKLDTGRSIRPDRDVVAHIGECDPRLFREHPLLALTDAIAAKQIVGWLSDEPMIYDKLTPLEYLEFVSGLWHVESAVAEHRARELLHWLDLDEVAGERCEHFSRGMRQKVALVGALLHEPRLIILDEPLTGLDAGSARLVKSVLTDRVAKGSTVIMTTHILEIAERMADRIGVISGGRLIAEGTLAELRQSLGASDTSLEDMFLAIVESDKSET